jgi:hypothetical protein
MARCTLRDAGVVNRGLEGALKCAFVRVVPTADIRLAHERPGGREHVLTAASPSRRSGTCAEATAASDLARLRTAAATSRSCVSFDRFARYGGSARTTATDCALMDTRQRIRPRPISGRLFNARPDSRRHPPRRPRLTRQIEWPTPPRGAASDSGGSRGMGRSARTTATDC